jgi:hypothetical protein
VQTSGLVQAAASSHVVPLAALLGRHAPAASQVSGLVQVSSVALPHAVPTAAPAVCVQAPPVHVSVVQTFAGVSSAQAAPSATFVFTHAALTQVSVVQSFESLHCTSVRHSTQTKPSASEQKPWVQSESTKHSTQAPLAVSHTKPVPQSALAVHAGGGGAQGPVCVIPNDRSTTPNTPPSVPKRDIPRVRVRNVVSLQAFEPSITIDLPVKRTVA